MQRRLLKNREVLGAISDAKHTCLLDESLDLLLLGGCLGSLGGLGFHNSSLSSYYKSITCKFTKEII